MWTDTCVNVESKTTTTTTTTTHDARHTKREAQPQPQPQPQRTTHDAQPHNAQSPKRTKREAQNLPPPLSPKKKKTPRKTHTKKKLHSSPPTPSLPKKKQKPPKKNKLPKPPQNPSLTSPSSPKKKRTHPTPKTPKLPNSKTQKLKNSKTQLKTQTQTRPTNHHTHTPTNQHTTNTQPTHNQQATNNAQQTTITQTNKPTKQQHKHTTHNTQHNTQTHKHTNTQTHNTQHTTHNTQHTTHNTQQQQQQQQQAFDSNTRFLVCVTVMFPNPADGSCADRAHGTGSARRRRERRLRSFLRHERMTVRMELAAALHHSSFRGSGPVTYDAPRSQRTANSRVDSVLFDLFDEDIEGAQPDRIATLSGPQARVQRHTVEQIVDAVPLVPLLDDPVPQTVEQLQDVLQFFDRLSAFSELVIEVPKIYTEDVPMRAVLRATQLVDQLVEAPVPVPSFDDWVAGWV